MLDAILSHLAKTSTKNPLPVLETLDDELEIQLAQKFARDGDNFDFPDLEDDAVENPEQDLFDTDLESGSAAGSSVSQIHSGILTRGRLRGRSSIGVAGTSDSLIPKRGLLSFQSSPPNPFESKSPPRQSKRLFANSVVLSSDMDDDDAAASSNQDSNVFGIVDEPIFDDDGMEIDGGSDDSSDLL